MCAVSFVNVVPSCTLPRPDVFLQQEQTKLATMPILEPQSESSSRESSGNSEPLSVNLVTGETLSFARRLPILLSSLQRAHQLHQHEHRRPRPRLQPTRWQYPSWSNKLQQVNRQVGSFLLSDPLGTGLPCFHFLICQHFACSWTQPLEIWNRFWAVTKLVAPFCWPMQWNVVQESCKALNLSVFA